MDVCFVVKTGWSEYDNNCYYYEANMNVTWSEALKYCRQNDSELASVYSIEELTFMRTISFPYLSQNDKERCENFSDGLWNGRDSLGWIGGLRYGAREDQTFKMIYDNTDIKKELWIPGEPNDKNSKEDAVELRCYYNDSSRLNDIDPNRKFNYFCKKQLAKNVPETTQSTPIQPDKGKIP